MADQAVAEKVQEMFDKLLGNKAEAESFSDDPEGWVADNGYGDLPADAVAECGVQYGSGATAVASSGGGYSPGVAGVAQAAAPSVYNTYIEDNDITTNIANNGVLNIGDNNVGIQGDANQVVTGDENVVAGAGGVAAGDDIEDSQIQTGSGIQAGDDVDIADSAVSTGSGDASNISDIDDSDLTNVNQGDAGGDINQAQDNSVDVETNIDDHSGTVLSPDNSVDLDVDGP